MIPVKLKNICVMIVAFETCVYLRNMIRYFYLKYVAKDEDLTLHGRWAVITGGSKALSRAFAENLAAKGFNIFLIGYNKDKLENIAKNLCLEFNVETKYFIADFNESCDMYEDLELQLEHYDIGILVNNIGVDHLGPKYFVNIPYSCNFYRQGITDVAIRNIVNSHVLPVSYISNIILKGMVIRRRGIVINVSSAFAEIPSPLLTIYSAATAYVKKFSVDMNAEYKNFGITVLCLQPAFLLSCMKPDPNVYVEEAIKSIGVTDVTCGYWLHSLMLILFQFCFAVYPSGSISFIKRYILKIQSKMLAKKKK